MEYRQFGRTGVKVSDLCLGCMMFGGRTSLNDSMDIIDKAIDAGINFFDTANVYNRGASEETVGDALQRNGKRNRVFLATKVHGRMADGDPNALGNHRRHIIEQCEASLRRLKTDWIDLYQLHRPDPDIPIDESLRALDDLVRAGKVRYIGTSTFAAWQVMESLWASRELRLNRFVSEQPPYHLLDRRIERELIPMAQTYGMAIIPWSPLARGFLTGKYQRGEQAPDESRLAREDWRRNMMFTEAAFDVLDVVEDLAAMHEATPSQVALAWVRSRPGVTSPIIGPRTMEQLEDNLGALEVALTSDDLDRLDEISPPGDSVADFYSSNWGPHPYRW